MKVLYLNPDRGIPVLGDKGASVHVREFVTALSRQGHEISLICTTLGAGNAPPPATIIELPPLIAAQDPGDDWIAQGLRASSAGNPILRREFGRMTYDRDFAVRAETALTLTGFRPDLIYERHALFHCSGATLARTLGVPRLLEVNAPLIREQEQYRGLFLRSSAEAMERASFRGADSIIAVSDEVAAYVAACGVPGETIMVVPNGVDSARFHPGADGEVVRDKLGLGTDPVIGFIGSFKAWHGVGFLVDAFAALAMCDPRARLLCVGEGPELEAARVQAAKLGLGDRVVFTGRVPHTEVPAYLAAMDISVAPYLADGDFYFSPLKVVEALAIGVPVVAARIGQLEWLVEHGKTGFLYNPGDQDDFIARMLELVGDPQRRCAMSAAASKRALSDFTWSAAVSRVIAEGGRHIDTRRAA